MAAFSMQCEALASVVNLVAQASSGVAGEPTPAHIVESLLSSRAVLQRVIDAARPPNLPSLTPLTPPNTLTTQAPKEQLTQEPTTSPPTKPKILPNIPKLGGSAKQFSKQVSSTAEAGASASINLFRGAAVEMANKAKRVLPKTTPRGGQWGGLSPQLLTKGLKKNKAMVEEAITHTYEEAIHSASELGEAAHRFMMSSAEIENATRAFQALDLNGDGTLTTEEVVEALSQMGFEDIENAEVDELINSVDDDKDGSVTLHEWLDIVHVYGCGAARVVRGGTEATRRPAPLSAKQKLRRG